MLKPGQIIRAPKDADLVMLREMKKQGLGNVLGVPGGAKFMILQALVEQAGIEQGDYMAYRPGWTTFYLLPKATAESWDLDVDPVQEDERRTLDALQVIGTELVAARTGPPRADGAPPAREVVLRYHHWDGMFEVDGLTDDTRFTRAKRDRLTSALRWYADQNDRPVRSPEHRGLTERCERAERERDEARTEVQRLQAERAALLAPVEGVDLEEVLLVSQHGRPGELLSLTVGWLASCAPALAREVARLRADNADLLATSDAYQHMHTRAVRAEAALEEARLDLKVESGDASGAPHPDWRCSNGRLRLYHRYYGGDLHAVVNADGDWMLYRAGGNMLEVKVYRAGGSMLVVKEVIASGPPQLKRSAMLAADVAATQVQEKP